jgi:hypothetical protein
MNARILLVEDHEFPWSLRAEPTDAPNRHRHSAGVA